MRPPMTGSWAARLALAVAVAAQACAGRAETPAETYTYAILDPVLGRIGTFTNAIRRDGEVLVIADRAVISVRALFVTMRRLASEGVAVWRDGRLVRYDRRIDEDGQTTEVRGWVEGEDFVIDGPAGYARVPADVVPANPWSLGFVRARRFISPMSGRVYDATVSLGEWRLIEHGGRTVPTRYHRAVGSGEEVWYDEDGVPLMFRLGEGGVTFTLESVAGRRAAGLGYNQSRASLTK
jgi:hypothetical protein